MDFTNHPIIDVMWTFFLIFIWVSWFWILISITIDVFRRHDIGGGAKALWLFVIIFLPLIGVLVYMVTQSSSMAARRQQDMAQSRQQTDAYIREVADSGGPAAEIERAKTLLDSGAITDAEFASIKAKALA